MMRIVRWFLALVVIISAVAPPGIAAASSFDDGSDMSTTLVGESTSSGANELTPPSQESQGFPRDMAVESEKVASQSVVTSAPTFLRDEPLGQEFEPSSVTVAPSPPLLYPETTPDLIVTTFSATNYLDVIEFYNQSPTPVDMSAVEIIVSGGRLDLDSEGILKTCVLRLATGWLLPKRYVTTTDASSLAISSQQLSGDCVFEPGENITSIQILYHGARVQMIDNIVFNAGQVYARHIHAQDKNGQRSVNASLKQRGSFTADYRSFGGSLVLLDESLYSPPASSNGLKLFEIMPVSRSCLPSDGGLDCGDYIKLKNTSTEEINIAEYRVRAGASASAVALTWHEPTLTPERDELILGPGQFFLLRYENDGDSLSLTNSAGHVWLEDYFGTKMYDEVSYRDMDKAASRERSWAFDAVTGAWRLGIPSPLGKNVFPAEAEPGKVAGVKESVVKPCRDDQYRSEETGRCRAVATASVLVPCREGQYRSEDTNRCRSIAATVASVLKPCADNQFRNPDSGRCKRIASSEELALADCGEGRERNPETNRCRNIKTVASIPEAAFAVESVKDTTKAFVGWWALGGIGVLALGYGAWEWRREITVLIARLASFFHLGK